MRINKVVVDENYIKDLLFNDNRTLTEISKTLLQYYKMPPTEKALANLRRRLGELKSELGSQNTDATIYFVIGDIHAPFTHSKYFDFFKSIVDSYKQRAYSEFNNPTIKIISIGDIIDGQAIKFHELDPNLPSSSDELRLTRLSLEKWCKEYPDVVVTSGNHDNLYNRRILSSGLPKECTVPLNTLLGIHNWTFCEEYVDESYNLLFTHGTKLTKNTIKQKALKSQKSVICGHQHTVCNIEYITQKIFTSFIGCGIDYESSAFDYARGRANDPILSCMVIYDGTPIIEIMR